jgi:heme-degrading monooxygenase HmoA
MILEAAVLSIAPAQKAPFEAAFAQARQVLAESPGYLAVQLQRCIEADGRYLLLIQWRTLDDHLIGFRGSPRFSQWRALIGPFFTAPPELYHYEQVGGEGAALQ